MIDNKVFVAIGPASMVPDMMAGPQSLSVSARLRLISSTTPLKEVVRTLLYSIVCNYGIGKKQLFRNRFVFSSIAKMRLSELGLTT